MEDGIVEKRIFHDLPCRMPTRTGGSNSQRCGRWPAKNGQNRVRNLEMGQSGLNEWPKVGQNWPYPYYVFFVL